MSVQLYLTNPDLKYGQAGHRHPDWDEVANGDHKRFARKILHQLPCEEREVFDGGQLVDWLIRPTDFAAWRAAVSLHGLCNAELFHQMIDIMEADRRYWLEVSG